MSRRKPADNSTSVSLFPFLAVLLCTMGALLVVLVAVSHSARNAALQQAAMGPTTAVVSENPAARAELDKIDQHMAKLKQLRADAEKKIREDQLRLGQLENHMRRLQDQLQSLAHAAAELNAMEEEHYDDHKQAERERNRLHQLISEKQAEIDALKDETRTRKRTYALLPYEGPNGTFRRAVYIECLKDELVLQPEGIRITRDDLRPPLGSGNPLASALRAARDHMMQHPEDGQDRHADPYPMLLIRPEGTEMFGPVRRAIEAADFDFGFEPVETHWELNFGVVDPQLANVEQQAVDQARIRQQLLAAAAPRAYRNSELAASGRFEFDDESGEPSAANFGRRAGNGSQSGILAPTTTAAPGQREAAPNDGQTLANGNVANGEAGFGTGGDASQPQAADNQQVKAAAGGTGPQASGSENGQAMTAVANTGGAPNSAASEESAASGSSADRQSAVASSSSPGDQQTGRQQEADPNAPADSNWQAPRTNARAVPIRRTIRVVVRDTQIGLLSDEARSNSTVIEGKTIEFKGDTRQSIDQFVIAVQDHVAGWGIAGNGLYWRPVLELQVGPDGQRRAEDLRRLLKNTDIEVRIPSTATNTPKGDSRATR